MSMGRAYGFVPVGFTRQTAFKFLFTCRFLAIKASPISWHGSLQTDIGCPGQSWETFWTSRQGLIVADLRWFRFGIWWLAEDPFSLRTRKKKDYGLQRSVQSFRMSVVGLEIVSCRRWVNMTNFNGVVARLSQLRFFRVHQRVSLSLLSVCC